MALTKVGVELNDEQKQKVIAVPHLLYRQHPVYFNTFGSDVFRLAVCRYIACLSQAEFAVSDSQKQSLCEILDSTVDRKEEKLQQDGSVAYGAFLKYHGIDENHLGKLLDKVHPSGDVVARRGYALVLGRMPVSLLSPDTARQAVDALCEAATLVPESAQNDTEARRNAVVGLTLLFGSFDMNSFPKLISPSLFRHAFTTLIQGLCDYSSDSRGDVGSWVREACIEASRVLIKLANGMNDYFDDDLCSALIGKVIQQSVEKIDRIRQCAGDFLHWVIHADVSHIRGRSELQKALPK